MIKYALRDLIKVGQLFKSTGVKGEMIGEIIPSLQEKLSQLNYIFIEENGQSLPYFIEYTELSGNVYFKFESINAPEQANKLANQAIYLDKEKLGILAVEVDTTESMVGFMLIKGGRNIGKVLEMVEYPGQWVLLVEGYKDTVIPFVEDWVEDIDVDKKTISMNFPDELLSLND